MEWTLVERRGRRNNKPYRQASCEGNQAVEWTYKNVKYLLDAADSVRCAGPEVPTHVIKGKQVVKGRFTEKSLEEKVQDMSAQVQRIKAEIADSQFYRLVPLQDPFSPCMHRQLSAQLVPYPPN